MYNLSDDQKERLTNGIQATFVIPFVDDIENFIWESIFAYTKNVPIVDPLTHVRSKRLFDVVDDSGKIGWSIKAVQHHISLPTEFEVVIQRADIFKKATELGFDELSLDSSPQELGLALLRHWYDEKVNKDAQFQSVEDKRVCILLKSRDRKRYAYFESQLVEYFPEDLEWDWTNETKTGLQARRNSDDQLVFRWYPNQKQFFERFILPSDAYTFNIEPVRLATHDIVALLLAKLQDRL